VRKVIYTSTLGLCRVVSFDRPTIAQWEAYEADRVRTALRPAPVYWSAIFGRRGDRAAVSDGRTDERTNAGRLLASTWSRSRSVGRRTDINRTGRPTDRTGAAPRRAWTGLRRQRCRQLVNQSDYVYAPVALTRKEGATFANCGRAALRSSATINIVASKPYRYPGQPSRVSRPSW